MHENSCQTWACPHYIDKTNHSSTRCKLVTTGLELPSTWLSLLLKTSQTMNQPWPLQSPEPPSAASVSRGSSPDTSYLAICSVSSLNTKCSELCSLVPAELENSYVGHSVKKKIAICLHGLSHSPGLKHFGSYAGWLHSIQFSSVTSILQNH